MSGLPGRMVSMTELGWGCLDTPVGQVSVGCTDAGVARVSYGPLPGPGPAGGTLASVLLEAALEELDDYFGGHLTRFNVPVDLGSAAGASRTVLAVLRGTVRFGQTVTYGALADRAGLGPGEPGSAMTPARVVGQIMAANPVPLIVPCHRVVAGSGLGGYSGGAGVEIKRWLLVFEGALPATLDWDPAGMPPRFTAQAQPATQAQTRA